jgi:hypothetical protein
VTDVSLQCFAGWLTAPTPVGLYRTSCFTGGLVESFGEDFGTLFTNNGFAKFPSFSFPFLATPGGGFLNIEGMFPHITELAVVIFFEVSVCLANGLIAVVVCACGRLIDGVTGGALAILIFGALRLLIGGGLVFLVGGALLFLVAGKLVFLVGDKLAFLVDGGLFASFLFFATTGFFTSFAYQTLESTFF